jgi:hypothetical protein
MTIRSDVLAIFQELDSSERYRRQRTDCRSVRGGRRSIRLAVSPSLLASRRTGAALTNLAALLRGAANAVLHHDKAVVLSTPIEPRSAGRELTFNCTSQPFFSSAAVNACARVVFPAAGGPKSSMIIRRTFVATSDMRAM